MNNKQAKKIILLIIILTVIDQIFKIVFLVSNAKIGNVDGWSIGILSREKTENNISYILVAIIAIIALVRYIKSNNSYGGTINYINMPHFSSLNLGYVYILITWIGMAVILTKYTSERIKEKKVKSESIENMKKEIENEKRNNSK